MDCSKMPPRAVWEIDTDAIASNAKEIARFAGKPLIAVVKADAYGHGARRLVPLLENIDGVKFFAVSCPEEGVELRKIGIEKPILLLSGFFKEELPLVKKYRLTPVVSDREQLLAVIKKKIPYHLNIDTGMGRLGFFKVPYALLKIFPPEGVMTHFPSADVDPAFTLKQIRIFKRLIRPLKVKYIHLQNSAGLKYKIPFANLVRVGLSLYGEYGSKSLVGKLQLKFPSKVKARILEVRRLSKGSCISYGCRYKLKRNSYIGVISFGYADGLMRCFSNRLKVFYRGGVYPVVGNITMDLTAVEFGNAKPQKGEWVEIVNPERKFSDMATLCGTIPYEIMTRIGKRVKRVYR
jgi:alanine racemase